MVIVLNSDYSFLQAVSPEAAMHLIHKGVVEPASDKVAKVFRTVNREYVVPQVLRLLRFIHRVFTRVPYTKQNVYQRDRYVCQYTGKKLRPEDATVDHVQPKSRGGESSFYNCVTCDKKINRLKGDRTPEEAGLTLLRKPYHPSINELIQWRYGTCGYSSH
jgi:5-methylcytosine-specific restriction endonuclease McrA